MWWKQNINHERGQLFRWLTVNDSWINDNEDKSEQKLPPRSKKKDWLNVYCFTSHSIFFRHNFVVTSDICSALTVLKHGGIYRAIPAMTRYPILTRTNAPFSRLLQQPGDTEDLSNLFSHVQIVFYLSDSRHPTISLCISKDFLWKNRIFYICN